MQDEYNVELDGTVILMRRIDYVEKGFDRRIVTSHGWSGELAPLRYQVWHLTREGEERLLGTATQYVPGTDWQIHGSPILQYLGVPKAAPHLLDAAAIFKQDADAFISSVQVEAGIIRVDE